MKSALCRTEFLGTGAIPVLFIANWPDATKGGQINLVRLLERLDRDRFRPTVVVSREGTISRRARECGVEVEVLKVERFETYRPDRLLTNLGPTRQLQRIIRSRGVRLVYVDSPGHLIPARAACAGSAAQVVWHAQTSAPMLLDRLFVRLADHIVCCSRAARDRFGDLAHDLPVVSNSVDCDEFVPAPASPARGRGGLNLLYLGELAASKGLPELLETLALVCREREGVTLSVAGQGLRLTEWRLRRQAAALGLGSRVRWLGYCPRPLELLQAADLFVFLSHSEGLSLALLEAMATGLPIVASAIPANVEALGGSGVAVPLRDPRAAAAAIIALVDDPARRAELGRLARERARAHYSITTFVRDFERLLAWWAGAGPWSREVHRASAPSPVATPSGDGRHHRRAASAFDDQGSIDQGRPAS